MPGPWLDLQDEASPASSEPVLTPTRAETTLSLSFLPWEAGIITHHLHPRVSAMQGAGQSTRSVRLSVLTVSFSKRWNQHEKRPGLG